MPFRACSQHFHPTYPSQNVRDQAANRPSVSPVPSSSAEESPEIEEQDETQVITNAAWTQELPWHHIDNRSIVNCRTAFKAVNFLELLR